MVTTLLIIYVIHSIMNYYGNWSNGVNIATVQQRMFLIFTGFFCTPFSILLLFKVLVSKDPMDEVNRIISNEQELKFKGWIFSTIFNGLILIIYFL